MPLGVLRVTVPDSISCFAPPVWVAAVLLRPGDPPPTGVRLFPLMYRTIQSGVNSWVAAGIFSLGDLDIFFLEGGKHVVLFLSLL